METRRSRVATGDEAQMQAEWRTNIGVSIHTLDAKVDALQAQMAVLQATYTASHAALVARVAILEVVHDKAPETFRRWSGLAITVLAVGISLACRGSRLLLTITHFLSPH